METTQLMLQAQRSKVGFQVHGHVYSTVPLMHASRLICGAPMRKATPGHESQAAGKRFGAGELYLAGQISMWVFCDGGLMQERLR